MIENELAEGPSDAVEAVEDPDRYTKAKALATSMNYASMYWHGLDQKGRPILWIRTDRMVSTSTRLFPIMILFSLMKFDITAMIPILHHPPIHNS